MPDALQKCAFNFGAGSNGPDAMADEAAVHHRQRPKQDLERPVLHILALRQAASAGARLHPCTLCRWRIATCPSEAHYLSSCVRDDAQSLAAKGLTNDLVVRTWQL